MKNGYLLVFLTAIISGFSIFINKYGVGVFKNPYLYTFLRVALVAGILSGILFFLKDFKKLKRITKKDWFILILIGLIGGSIPFLLFFKGLSMTSAAQGSFLHKTMFVYVAILATFYLKEKIDKKFILGGLLLLIGNFIALKSFSFSFQKGDFLVLLATFLWAIENVLSKYLLKNLEGREVAWGRMFFGSIFIFIYLIFTGSISSIFSLNAKQFFWVLITGFLLFLYVISWYSGLKFIPVSQATCILLLGSPITTVLSFISDGKILSKDLISGILVILGIIFILGIKEIFGLLKDIKKLVYVFR